MLEEEREAALAATRNLHVKRQEDAEAQREAARQEAIAARVQEQQMLKAARSDVVAALVMAMELVPLMREVKHIIAEALAIDPATGKRPKLPLTVAMGLLTRHATLVQKGVGAAEAVLQMSRLDRGASTVNIGMGVAEEDMTEEEILAEMEACEEVLRGARDARALPAHEPDGRQTRRPGV